MIDRAVRDMMNVDTDAAFRARVFARLERPAGRWLTLRRVALPGVAIAALVVVLALVLPRMSRNDAPQTAAERSVAVPSRITADPVRGAAPAMASSTGPREPARTVRKVPSTRNITQQVPAGALVASVADEGSGPALESASGSDIEVIDGIAPLAVAPLESPSIAARPIVITAIAPITAVEIAPLSPQTRRD